MTTANVSETLTARPDSRDEMERRTATLVRSASIEATPRQIYTEQHLSELLPTETLVYVPFLPKGQFTDTLNACVRIREQGMQPVPHIPARMVDSRAQLEEWLSQLQDHDVDRFLLIAGDRDNAFGPFPDTLTILESGLLARFNFTAIGVAAHPDGHPRVDRAALARALDIKREYARTTGTRLWVVTQFTFDAQVIIDWLQSLGTILEKIPVYIGIAGPTRVKTLMAYASQCGLSASTRQLLRRPGSARLLRSWTPDSMVRTLVQYCLDHPDTLLKGIHLFPFGGLRQSAQWIHEHSRPLDGRRRQTDGFPVQ